MSDLGLYGRSETMNHWPYLLKSERIAKLAPPPRECMDSFFLELDAKAQFTPVLAWKASAGCLCGSWRA